MQPQLCFQDLSPLSQDLSPLTCALTRPTESVHTLTPAAAALHNLSCPCRPLSATISSPRHHPHRRA